MFTATWGSQVLYDPRTDEFRLIDQECTAGLTDASSYTFTMPPDHPLAGLVEPMDKKREIVLRDDGAEVFRGRVLTVETGFDGCATYSCEGVRAYLNDAHCEPYRCGEGGVPSDAAGLFAWYVGQYNRVCGAQGTFEVGVNDGRELCRDPLSIEEGGRPGVWDQIRSNLVDAYGGVVRVRTEGERRYIDWLADGTRECRQRVEFGVNLTDFLRTRDASGAATRVVPFSAGVRGEGDEEDPPDTLIGGAPDRALADGYRKVGDAVVDVGAEERRGVVEAVLDCGEGKGVDELVQAAVQELRNRALGDTVEVSTVDLHKVDPGVERISVGDLVRVTSLPHGFDAVMMCREAVYRPDDACATLTLGAGTPRLTRVQASRDRSAAASFGAGLSALGRDVEQAGSLASAAGDRAAGLAVEMEMSKRVIAEVREGLEEAAGDALAAREAAQGAAGEAQAAKEAAEAARGEALAASEEAGEARRGAAQAADALEAFKADAGTTYATKKEVEDAEGRVSTKMEATYVNKDQVGTTLVTSTQLTQTAESLRAQASKDFETALASYATKADVELSADGVLSQVASSYVDKEAAKSLVTSTQLSQKADEIKASAQQSMESALASYATKTELSQRADSILSSVSADYVNKETGATYATKTEVAQSAEGVLSQVASSYVDKETGRTYATSTQLAQAKDSILATVASTYVDKETGKTYATATQLSQTEKSILASVASGYVDKATGATYATKSALTATESSIKTEVASTYLSKGDASKTYTSKTELSQTSEALELSIEKVASRVLFGTCSTAAATAAKAVSIEGFALRSGAAVDVLFANANSAQSPTLNVSGTGAKPVRLYGTSTFGTTAYSWVANAVVRFVYDGTYWRIADSSAMYRANQGISEARAAAGGVTSLKTLIRADDDGVTVGQSADDGATYTSARARVGSDGTFSVLAPGGEVLSKFGANSASFASGTTLVGYSSGRSRLYSTGQTPVMVYSNDADPPNHGALVCQPNLAGIYAGDGSSDALGTGGYVSAEYSKSAAKSYVSVRGDALRVVDRAAGASSDVSMALFRAFAARLANGTATYTMGYGSKLCVNYAARTATVEMAGAQTVTIPASSADWQHVVLGTLGATYRPAFTVRFPLLDIYGLGGQSLYFEVYGKDEANAGQIWVVNPQPKQFSGYLHGCGTWTY